MLFAAALLAALHLLPRPDAVTQTSCARPFGFMRPLTVARNFDAGAFQEINERWKALGIRALRHAGVAAADVRVRHANGAPESYSLQTGADGTVDIAATGSDGAFYAAMTLAQLPVRAAHGWTLPCVRISDAPALRWRVLSDDVSRGPLPNMRYFKERIRTIAAFKMNGYSPYMEQVFAAPGDALPAPLDGITPAQLRELAQYAARFHVSLIPEQQTFAHMHNTLRYEKYAAAAEQPHSFLLSPASPLTIPYVRRLIDAELAAVPHPPFVHIGSDETSSLGQGLSKALADKRGLTALYAEHIRQVDAIVRPSGARTMLWDDGIENDPRIMQLIPRDAVVVNWHYGNDRSFKRYIDLIARGGFDQMVSPGDSNWNQIYPDIETALSNESTFIGEGKNARVLGLFQTVWHDDGESLFEATWYPVLYAGVAAWERGTTDPARYRADFPQTFFGVNDARYGKDVAALADIQSRMADSYGYTSHYLLWADPFGALFQKHMKTIDVSALRLEAERVQEHLLADRPPLHPNAARVMFLAAREYDFIGRKFQAASEIRDVYYGKGSRGSTWAKYWFWEMRDAYEELAPLYAAAWRYENRESGLQSNVERYHAAAQQNIARADRVFEAMLNQDATKTMPPLEEILRP
ncbi:MAG: family 20 glycosylhydrolase [Candidatus Baltobacteraceae bacterium]